MKLAVFDFGLYFWVHFVAPLRVPGPAAPRPLTAGPLGHDGEPVAGQSPTARFNAFTARALAANGDGEHGHRRVQLACADWKTRSRGTTRNDPKTAALRLEVVGKLDGNNGGMVAVFDGDIADETKHWEEGKRFEMIRMLTPRRMEGSVR